MNRISERAACHARKCSDRRHPDDDRGAALILAIGFVVMIGAISAGLIGLVTSSLDNRTTLTGIRDREYAADGAIENAIAGVRTATTGSVDLCAAAGTSSSRLNAVDIRVDWVNACTVVRGSTGVALTQRNLVFSACIDTKTACTDNTIIIRAQVNFEQRGSGPVTGTAVQTWSVNR